MTVNYVVAVPGGSGETLDEVGARTAVGAGDAFPAMLDRVNLASRHLNLQCLLVERNLSCVKEAS